MAINRHSFEKGMDIDEKYETITNVEVINTPQRVELKNIKTDFINQSSMTETSKSSNEFVGGAYVNGQVALSKNGKWETFGDMFVGKQFNGKGDVQVEGQAGVRFKF